MLHHAFTKTQSSMKDHVTERLRTTKTTVPIRRATIILWRNISRGCP